MELNMIDEVVISPLASYEKKMKRLHTIAHGVIAGIKTHGAIFSGGPGIGKSHNIESLLNLYEDKIKVTKITGKITPLSTYLCLLENADSNNVIWFDDADSVFTNEDSLNILKAATDNKVKRLVSWVSTANDSEQSFFFNGKVIISTNISIRKTPHFMALRDRFNCYDLDVTTEEKLHKIKDLAKTSEDIPEEVGKKVLEFLFRNKEKLNDISLRTFVKTSGLVMDMPEDEWEDIASCIILDK